MENLTREELLDLIVALDNEAARDTVRADALRNLKWKLFAMMVKLEREAA